MIIAPKKWQLSNSKFEKEHCANISYKELLSQRNRGLCRLKPEVEAS
jgi:hypothetical protein